MKKLIFCILVWQFALSPAFAQRSEVGVFAGGSFYIGDLNPLPEGLFSQAKVAAGVVYRYNLSTRWALRGNVLFGTITADDAKHDNLRNLNFRSRIGEFSIQTEINFLTYFTGSRNYRFSPYIFGGVGVFTFNPQGYYEKESRWIDLRPLKTEGQGLIEYPDVKEYNTVQIVFPFGLGFKYSLNRTFSVGAEWGMRKTFTDYLDDVGGFYADPAILAKEIDEKSADMSDRTIKIGENGSTAPDPQPIGSRRGSSNKTDWYSFFGVNLTMKVGRSQQTSCPAYRKSAADRVKRQMGDF
jgi:hypothetical protein